MKNLKSVFFQWLPFGVTITLLCLVMYGAVQRTLRYFADSSSIQMAEDTARAYASGRGTGIFFGDPMDVSKTLSPFIVVYNDRGEAVTGNGVLDSRMPVPPLGVFEYAKIKGEHMVTWEPRRGLRIATAVIHYTSDEPNSTQSGFVLAGRSLRGTERFIEKLGFDIFIGWMTTMICSFAVIAFLRGRNRVLS